jgi:hypothetical protein
MSTSSMVSTWEVSRVIVLSLTFTPSIFMRTHALRRALWEGKKEAISLPVFFLGPRAFSALHFRPRVASRDVLSDRLLRKGSSGACASLGDVPLAIGQPRQQLTSSAACEEAVFLRFVQNEPLERSLSVRES